MTSYETYEVSYAERRRSRAEHLARGDPHDGPMPMDYFVWLLRNGERTIVVDTGFSAEVAARRRRHFLRSAGQGLELLGERAGAVRDVVITHMHNDHAGTLPDFPAAT